MSENRTVRKGGDERWAHFRFSVIGRLLAAPPRRGELKEELQRLAQKAWRHPISGKLTFFGASTIERWYYKARNEPADPVAVLARKVREDKGTSPSLSPGARTALFEQYRQHPSWTYQLHADNLAARVKREPELGPAPSYPSVRRFMKAHGLLRRPRRGRRRTAGVEAAEQRFESLEVRSYESEYVNGLWHVDFHNGSVPVLLAGGQWRHPRLFAMLDDRSRLCAHAQWYLSESAETLVHGLCQGIEKRALPRALMSDNGAAMIAAETVQGLQRLGIHHEKTLAYSPYQNGKQEVFWAQLEGRLVAMLENVKDLSLGRLNEATQAWVELEYNRKVHSETGQSPLKRFLNGKDVGRASPASDALRRAFTEQVSRTQRLSDGTLSVEGVRFEAPSRYGHLKRLTVRFATWDLTHVYLADARSGEVLCRLYPQNKHKNADGRRRRRKTPLEPADKGVPATEEVPPLLAELLARYAATGLPPAYLPKDEQHRERNAHDE